MAGAASAADATPAAPRIVAAGAGRMGRSMAVAFAYAGVGVDLLDLKARDAAGQQAVMAAAEAEIVAHLETLAELGVLTGPAGQSAAQVSAQIAARIRFCPLEQAPTVLAAADWVFEGVPEVLDSKREAFALIEGHARPDCIIASTTSSFLSSELATMLTRPARFLNAHWLNPAYLIPLVEVSPHESTDADVLTRTNALLASIGKETVTVKASPGYIVPRLQALIMNEAVRMVEEGVATPADIDKATRLGFGLRYASMGVLEFVDFGGLDILYYASKYLAGAVDERRYQTPELVESLMAQGQTGVRAGQGLYDWRDKNPDQFRREALGRFVDLLREQELINPPVCDQP